MHTRLSNSPNVIEPVSGRIIVCLSRQKQRQLVSSIIDRECYRWDLLISACLSSLSFSPLTSLYNSLPAWARSRSFRSSVLPSFIISPPVCQSDLCVSASQTVCLCMSLLAVRQWPKSDPLVSDTMRPSVRLNRDGPLLITSYIWLIWFDRKLSKTLSKFPGYNMNCIGKWDITQNIPRSISFCLLHFVLNLWKSITFSTV